jgi:phosphatidylglycerophosphatase A
VKLTLVRLLATVGGLGDRLPAPGTTVGSAAGVLLYLAGVYLTVPAVVLAGPVTVVLFAVAVWACGREAAARGIEDPGPVVLDEVAGMWLALMSVHLAAGGPLGWPAILALYLAFRFFDILKPWPVSRLERLPGGAGIVADDLAAGLLAALAVWLIHWVGLLGLLA